ncbi:DUF3180 domain-containing protein [Arcanobacterium hippocoleae]
MSNSKITAPQHDDEGNLKPTSAGMLFIVLGISLTAAFFFVDSWIISGNMPFMTPRWGFLVPSFIAVFVIWQGWLVRSYQERKRTLNPLTAGRIWLFSQAASRTGAIMCGIALGVVISYARYGNTSFLSEQIVNFCLQQEVRCCWLLRAGLLNVGV